ncbi:MAG: cyclic nucleotide-binding domain-containing protein [Pseudomonadota bacterium]
MMVTRLVLMVILALVALFATSAASAQEVPDTEKLSDWAKMFRDAGPEALQNDWQELPFLDKILTAFDSISAGFWVGLAMLIILLTLQQFISPTLRRRLGVPIILLYVYLGTIAVALFSRLYLPGIFKLLYFLSLGTITLAGVLVGAFAVVDVAITRRREAPFPAIIRDIIVVLVYLVALFVVLGNQGLDLTAILASAGFVGLFVGLAMQDTLGNLVSGLAMSVEKPFDVGDWVRCSDQVGKVVETNWRSVTIETPWADIVTIPNSVITKAPIINYSRPARNHRRKVNIGLPYNAPPEKVKRIFMDVLRRVPAVSMDPVPRILLREYGDFSIRYKILFFINDFGDREIVEDEVMSRIWYALKRAGIRIPFPISDVYLRQVKEEEATEDERAEGREVRSILERVSFFRPLSDEDMDYLAAAGRREFCPADEIVVRQGDPGHSFYVILDGTVSVDVKGAGGEDTFVARLSRGDYFGEMSLMTGERRSATVRTLRDTEFLVVDKSVFKKIIESHPEVVGRISELIVARRMQIAEEEARSAKRAAENANPADHDPHTLMSRIMRFFSSD